MISLEKIKEDALLVQGILTPDLKIKFEQQIGLNVINISNLVLTPDENDLLSKGLTFSPTPKGSNTPDLWLDFKDFQRSLDLKQFFMEQPPSDSDPKDPIKLKFRNKSSWKPPVQYLSTQTLTKTFKKYLLNNKNNINVPHNITKKQELFIQNIRKNNDITIKKADKGAAVVIMNTTDYIREGYRQLSNPDFYQKLDHDITDEVSLVFAPILEKLLKDKLIDEKIHDYLTLSDPKPCRFYMLPKIHKKDMPGRPICSSINHPTNRISAFIDEHIKGYVPQTSSYIRDTQDFIQKVLKIPPLNPGDLIVTMDVVSLYTNIPNHDACISVSKWLLNDPTKKDIARPLLHLLRQVLHNTNFVFNGEHFLQVGGTSMGTPCAPSVANIFLDKEETKFIKAAKYKPSNYYRFIDDIWFIWTHGETKLHEFLQYMNSTHRTIKYTMEYSPSEVVFLDTITKRDTTTNKLYTTLYQKPTDTHSYLHWSSAHPTHCKTKGPYGQFLRLKRICTKTLDYDCESNRMIQYYRDRGYPYKILMNFQLKAREFTQLELLIKKTKVESKDRQIFVTQYNPRNLQIDSWIRRNWNIFQALTNDAPQFRQKPMIAYRKLPTLGNLLTKATVLYPAPGPKPKTKPLFCKKSPASCSHCKDIHRGRTIKSTANGKLFERLSIPTVGYLTCQIPHVIYCITCKKCNHQYVGQTSRKLRDRMYEHKRSITNPKVEPTPVSRHFSQKGHNVNHLRFQVLEWIQSDPKTSYTHRLRRENFWIWSLKTLHPYGINQMM